MTKIDIISGFLGAGKTTFIKKLLEEAISGEQVVLIENEFGQIGIDGGFLKDAGIEIREMNSGCICCSLVGDFGKSLEEVLTKYKPDRVIIEPSGVGKLSDVMKAVRDVAGTVDVELNSAVTIVDASKCKMYMKNFGEFFNNQVEYAGTIVLSRTDVLDAGKVQKAVELIREHNQTATIVTTPCTQLTGEQLLEIIEKPDTMAEDLMKEVKEQHTHHHEHGEACGCESHTHHHHEHGEECGYEEHGHHHHEHGEECGCEEHEHHHHEHDEECSCGCHEHHHHHADEVFSSWGMENVGSCDRASLEEILDELANGNAYGDILRAKGMMPSENPEEWYYFDLVPDEFEIRMGKPDYTGKVCVIGARLKEAELNKAFGRS
ncbi:MAG: cobalamin biosynthesis protein CobW [Hungatella sp.]|nr:cobalamin biosynthesis protein CobW [Hungatella sp.]